MSDRGTARNVVRVGVSSGSLANCINHAFTTEGEEIMGLLLGNTHEVSEGSFVTNIWRAVPQIRNDRRKDRVECGGEQMAHVAQTAEQMSASTGRETRVVGWYHSHPHITALPSHIDIATQEGYQRMDGGFVGIIVSCFNDVTSPGPASRLQVLAFQSVPGASPDLGAVDHAYLRGLDSPTRRAILESSEEARGAASSGLVHRLVPLHVDASLDDGPAALADAAALQDILFQEEARPYHAARRALAAAAEGVGPDELLLARQHAGALYAQGLTELLQTALLPALGAVRGLRCTAEQERTQLLRRLEYARDHMKETDPGAAQRADAALAEHSAKQVAALRELQGRHAQRQAAIQAACVPVPPVQKVPPRVLPPQQAPQPLPQPRNTAPAPPQEMHNAYGSAREPPPQQAQLYQQYRQAPATHGTYPGLGEARASSGAASHAADRSAPSSHNAHALQQRGASETEPSMGVHRQLVPEQHTRNGAQPPHAGEQQSPPQKTTSQGGALRSRQDDSARGPPLAAPSQAYTKHSAHDPHAPSHRGPVHGALDDVPYGSALQDSGPIGDSPHAPPPHSGGRAAVPRGDYGVEAERAEQLSSRLASVDVSSEAAGAAPATNGALSQASAGTADDGAWPALGAGGPPGEASPRAPRPGGGWGRSPVVGAAGSPQMRDDTLFQGQLPPPARDPGGGGGGDGSMRHDQGRAPGGAGGKRASRSGRSGRKSNFPPDRRERDKNLPPENERVFYHPRYRPDAPRKEDVLAGRAPDPRPGAGTR